MNSDDILISRIQAVFDRYEDLFGSEPMFESLKNDVIDLVKP